MRAARRLTLLAVALLGGCGQKGPLYLPDKGGAVVTPPPAAPAPGATPAPAQSAPAPQDTSATPPKKTDKDDDDSKSPH
jgi:polar amino acid transport system substrate-binding protein